MLMTRLDQLKLATRGLVLDEASHDSLKTHRPTLGAKIGSGSTNGWW